MGMNRNHEVSHLSSRPPSQQFDPNMDDLRDSLSKFRKDFKHRFGGRKPKEDKLGASGCEESVGPSSLLPQPEPHVLMGGGREKEKEGPNVEEESIRAVFAADKSRLDWKYTVSPSAKLVLRAVRDSADAFGPLKSIAGGLCFILESCEVQYLPSYTIGDTNVSAENKGERTDN